MFHTPLKQVGRKGLFSSAFPVALPDWSRPSLKSPSPLPKDVSEAELVGNSGLYSGCEKDLLKVTAPACALSPPALVPLCL